MKPFVGNQSANKYIITILFQIKSFQNGVILFYFIHLASEWNEFEFFFKFFFKELLGYNIVEYYFIGKICADNRRQFEVYLSIPGPFVPFPVNPVLTNKNLFSKQAQRQRPDTVTTVLN